MSGDLNPLSAIRLEQVAFDNGFNLVRPRSGRWLAYDSNQTRLKLWLTHYAEDTLFLAAFSRGDVASALEGMGAPFIAPLPEGAVAGRSAADLPALYRLVRRAFQLARALPNEPLQAFRAKVSGLPRSTETERWVVQRVGQDVFRASLIDFWDGRCAVTGLAVTPLLRASHIKPWADCESDEERLDAYNGLLLAPHLDAAFDAGFVTFDDDGRLVRSPVLTSGDQEVLGLSAPMHISGLREQHRRYLEWHRSRVFRASLTAEP